MTRDERLNALRRRVTRYEMAAILADGTAYLLGYSRPLAASALLNLALPIGPQLAAVAGVTEGARCTYSRDSGWTFADGRLRIANTGRTERAAIIEGELPSWSTP